MPVQSIAESTFHIYRAGILLSGLLLVVLAARGFGATPLARVFSGGTGVIFAGYAVWLWLFIREGRLYAVYPWLFILPALVIGYHFYTRTENREAEAAARRALEAERAARRAARASEQPPEPPADAAPPTTADPA